MHKNAPIIRDARREEWDQVAALLRNAYSQYARFFSPDAWKFYMEDMSNIGGRMPDSELIVAEVDGRLAGTVTLYLKSRGFEVWPKGWAGIRLLGVDPDFRGQGIGRSLVEACTSRCRQKGFEAIGLHTGEFMEVARSMYERMGFVRVPEFDFYPVPGSVAMAYRLLL